MTNRRSFLKRLGAAGIVPVAGSLVLTNPYVVAGPSGVLVPDNKIMHPSPEEPLVLATDELPNMVAPIEAYVRDAQLDIERLTLNAMRSYGALGREVAYGPATVRLRLDLVVNSGILSRDQLTSLFGVSGATVKLWVES